MNAMESRLRQPLRQALPETTIGECFAELALRHSDRIAIVDDRLGCRWTYRDLALRVAEWRTHLTGLKLGANNRVALLCENSAEWVSVWLACTSAGVTVVSLNLALNATEVRTRVRRLNVSHVFASDFALASTGLPGPASALDERSATTIHILSRADLLGAEASTPTDSAPSENDTLPKPGPHSPCLICFSSGTTGHAKAIVLTHRNLLANAALVGNALGYRAGDTVLCLFPYLVAGGAVIGVLGVLARGATIVCPPIGRQRATLVEALDRHCPNRLMGSPRLIEIIFDGARRTDPFVGKLATIGMGSTLCLPKFVNRLLDEFSIPGISLIYGMSETSPVTFLHTIDTPVGSDTVPVGHLLPGLEAKVIDDSGNVVKRGIDGELCVRGHAVMTGYCDDIEATRRTIDADGWLHTGDIAHFDDAGLCVVSGRQSECIRFRAHALHPHVLERVFLHHPFVENAQVVALPDGRCGAWVKPIAGSRLSRRALLEYYRTHRGSLPPIEHVRPVPSFPLNETGKIQRSSIAEDMAKRIARRRQFRTNRHEIRTLQSYGTFSHK
jgi:fatty-acyl-CoA synthase